jgi:uncharacterized repeat protein (TIGR01451 family)
MNDLKKDYAHSKLLVIVLLLLSLSLNAACSSLSEEANRTDYEEASMQWNLFKGEMDISSLIPSDDDLPSIYHPPSVRIREPQNGMIFTAYGTANDVTIPVHVTSSGEYVEITLIYDGDEYNDPQSCTGEANCAVTFNLKAEVGRHTIYAKAVDCEDAECSSLPVTFIVNPSDPLIEISSPINGRMFYASDEIEIVANVQSSHSISKVEFFANNQKLSEDTTSPYSYEWTDVKPGVYRLFAKATIVKDSAAISSISNSAFIVVVPENPLAKADLGLTMSSLPNPALIGGNLNYILTLTNFGPSKATNIVLTDFLPAGLRYENSEATQGEYDENGTWNVGSLDPYHSARLTIFSNVSPETEPGNIHNEATVAGAQRDDDTSDNYAEEYTLLIRRT